MLFDRNDLGFQLQSINGFNLNATFIGAGIGIDTHSGMSIPIFGDFRYFFPHSRITFLFADAGYNVALKNQRNENPVLPQNLTKSGLYTAFGGGVQPPIFKKIDTFLQIGYSLQPEKNIDLVGTSCPDCLPSYGEETPYNLTKYGGRVMVSAGFIF